MTPTIRHPRSHQRWVPLARGVALCTLVVGCTLTTQWGTSSGGASIVGTGSSQGEGPRSASAFSISGAVKGLFPGRTAPLVLTVRNPLTRAFRVTLLSTIVSGASASCAASNVTVTAFVGSLVVAPKHHAKLTVKAKMAHTASNACQGAGFTFHYHGLAKAI